MANYKVLSTKKMEPSLIEKARENDIEIIEQEFISIMTIDDFKTFQLIFIHLKKPYAVFTSDNAVASFAYYLHPNVESDHIYLPTWKIFCLNGKTKEAILNIEAIKRNIVASAENARDLAKKIIEKKVKEVVFFCGDKRREELPTALKNADIQVHEIVLYKTIETPVAMSNNFDAILFFSPSAVQSFFSVNQLKKKTVCFAIGQTTADSISNFCENRIIVSELPSQEKMLTALCKTYKVSKTL